MEHDGESVSSVNNPLIDETKDLPTENEAFETEEKRENSPELGFPAEVTSVVPEAKIESVLGSGELCKAAAAAPAMNSRIEDEQAFNKADTMWLNATKERSPPAEIEEVAVTGGVGKAVLEWSVESMPEETSVHGEDRVVETVEGVAVSGGREDVGDVDAAQQLTEEVAGFLRGGESAVTEQDVELVKNEEIIEGDGRGVTEMDDSDFVTSDEMVVKEEKISVVEDEHVGQVLAVHGVPEAGSKGEIHIDFKAVEYTQELKGSQGEHVQELTHVGDGLSVMFERENEVGQMDQEEEKIGIRGAVTKLEAESDTEAEAAEIQKLSNSELIVSGEGSSSRHEQDRAADHQEILTDQGEEIPAAKQGDVQTTGRMEAEIGTEAEAMKDQEGEPASPLDDTQVSPDEEEDDAMIAEEAADLDSEMGAEIKETDEGRGTAGKRKRGRKSKSPASSKAASSAPPRKKGAEDVCFICHDGGELVLCDRRGCPKAYHPSCVNHDEAFFQTKRRWNCGWHHCSICQKNAHSMCYTCPYSLCKGCIKQSTIFGVRGNKGFCETCMRTVMLIESKQGSEEAQIDFDDSSSWEYLFKDYYIDLKRKLSLSSAEIANARNSWKASDVLEGKQGDSKQYLDTSDDAGSDSDDYTDTIEMNKSRRRKVRKQTKSSRREVDFTSTVEAPANESSPIAANTGWATEDLLEFVMHMKNGDTSILSQFDVQALLLEYIKINKLRDPRRKSQIICDARLERLFGKPRVGHFEMLKLLESHFLTKEDPPNDDVQGTATDVNQFEDEMDVDTLRDGKRKTRKKGGYRVPQSNVDDYAAIDMHNISLIFLKRKLVEDLLEDEERFNDKAVGTFVRIRISGSTQKQDLYRLVQVIGTSKAGDPYKVGKRTTDILLEISNLSKTEIISIDTISNQEFTEEECKRLRQSIKCGLIKRLTVGDILDKATEIQAARVNDWLESEIVRLSHLRDRASEKGRRKELRECVEKLQLLKTPEERQRRLEEIPEIHADPNMDPNHESADEDSGSDDNNRESNIRSRHSSFSRRGRGPVSPRTNFVPRDSRNSAGRSPGRNLELNRNLSGRNIMPKGEDIIHPNDMVSENSWYLRRDGEMKDSGTQDNKLSASNSETLRWNSSPVSRSGLFPGVASETSPPSPSEKAMEATMKINESEKIWHYEDPSRKVQGPFSMVQLRKWNSTGYFPPDLRIWMTGESGDDSILLSDALAGRFQKESPTINITISTSGVQRSPHIKTPETPSWQASEGAPGERTNADRSYRNQNFQSPDPPIGVMTPLPTESWGGGDPLNLPSPTPKRGNVSWTGGGTSGSGGSGVTQSPAAAFGDMGVNFASEQGIHVSPANYLQISQSTNQPPLHLVPNAQDTNFQSNQTVNSQSTILENHGWGSAFPPKVELNHPVPVSEQPLPHRNWGAMASSIQNPTGLPQADPWRPPPQVYQSSSGPNVPWGAGTPQYTGARPEYSNASGVTTANNGWGATGNTNTNWGTPIQALPPGNVNSGWTIPPGNQGASLSGPMPSNVNPWVASPGNPGGQGLTPGGNANSGWAAPSPITGSTVPRPPPPGNMWAPPPGNPTAQVPPFGNTNQGWSGSAVNQGSWGNEQPQNGGKFPGHHDNRSQGRDPGFGRGRAPSRASSFGSGRPGGSNRHPFRSKTPCPYNMNGRCRKGAACDYLHN